MIDDELNSQLGGTPAADKSGTGFVKQTQADGDAYSLIKNRTVQLFQQTGNHVGAAQQAIHEARKGWLAAPGRAPGTGTAEHPARKMADSDLVALCPSAARQSPEAPLWLSRFADPLIGRWRSPRSRFAP